MKTLPSMEHTFSLEVKGSNTGKVWDGKFTYKRPNLRMQSEIAKTAAKLNEDLKNLDEEMQFLHRVLSVLRHTLIDAPKWWIDSMVGLEVYDANVIFELYKQTQDFEDNWFKEVWSDDSKEEEKKEKEKKNKE
jgi:hypothetical protein